MTTINPAGPSQAALAAVDPRPWWQKKTTWAAFLTFALGLPALVSQFVPFLPPKWAAVFTTAAAFLAALAGLFAGQRAVQSAARALDRAQGRR